METLDRLCAMLPEADARGIRAMGDGLSEVRLRAGRPLCLRDVSGGQRLGGTVSAAGLTAMSAALMDHSLYAREAELRQGFFTMPDGCRVGVCGRVVCTDGGIAGMTAIGSVCVRVCREVHGCADRLLERILDRPNGTPRSALVLSAPGMGKTTCLRELARGLSGAGRTVAVADERRELAACRDGVPTLDVGPCTDVMDGCPKHVAVIHLLRSMAPEVIVTDEIGAPEDAAALSEAARCGASVIASAHAADLSSALRRRCLAGIVRGGAFELIAELGDHPGVIRSIREWPGAGA